MSEVPQGPDWWQASDGRGYAPHLYPTAQPPPTVSSPPVAAGNGGSGVGRGVLLGVVGALIVFALAAAAVALVANKPSRPTGTVSTAAETTTTTAPATQPLTDPQLVSQFGDAVYRVDVTGCDLVGSGSA